MYIIQTILGELRSRFQAKQLSNEILPAPKDIDVYVDRLYRPGIEPFLIERGFTCTGSSSSHAVYSRYIEGNLYAIDILFDFQYLDEVFGSLAFSSAFTDAVLADRGLEKFVRYVFLLRKNREALVFVQRYADTYFPYVSSSYYVRPNIFRRKPGSHDLLRIMQRQPVALLRYVRFRYVWRLGAHYFRSWYRRLISGRIIAVVGPDGSGKSSVIDKLMFLGNTKQMYMGDWGFMFQPLYNMLHRQHIVIARLSYPFYYIENWIRYIRAYYWKLRGHIVLTDRYPGLNRHLRRTNTLLKLNDFMYRFFPSADRYIFISADPEIIHARKPELSVEEIKTSQENIRQRLTGEDFIEVENVDLDLCLNTILRWIVRNP